MILYRHPDNEEGGGKEPEEKPTVDAAAAQEIGALKHQLEQAQAAAERYQKLQGDVSVLFNPSAGDEARQAALSKVMQEGGISEEDVKAMMTEVLEPGEGTPEPKPENQPAPAAGEPKPDPLAGKVAELEQALQSMQETSTQHRQEQSKEALKAAVESALQTSPDANQLLTRLETSRGKEHAEKVAGILRKDVLRETLENLYARKVQVGQFNPGWIAEEAAKAAEATLEKAKSLVVSDNVGKAPGVLDEGVMLSKLAEQDLKPPTYDKDKSRADNTAAADDWTVQRLQQMAAQNAVRAAQGGESKA